MAAEAGSGWDDRRWRWTSGHGSSGGIGPQGDGGAGGGWIAKAVAATGGPGSVEAALAVWALGSEGGTGTVGVPGSEGGIPGGGPGSEGGAGTVGGPGSEGGIPGGGTGSEGGIGSIGSPGSDVSVSRGAGNPLILPPGLPTSESESGSKAIGATNSFPVECRTVPPDSFGGGWLPPMDNASGLRPVRSHGRTSRLIPMTMAATAVPTRTTLPSSGILRLFSACHANCHALIGSGTRAWLLRMSRSATRAMVGAAK